MQTQAFSEAETVPDDNLSHPAFSEARVSTGDDDLDVAASFLEKVLDGDILPEKNVLESLSRISTKLQKHKEHLSDCRISTKLQKHKEHLSDCRISTKLQKHKEHLSDCRISTKLQKHKEHLSDSRISTKLQKHKEHLSDSRISTKLQKHKEHLSDSRISTKLQKHKEHLSDSRISTKLQKHKEHLSDSRISTKLQKHKEHLSDSRISTKLQKHKEHLSDSRISTKLQKHKEHLSDCRAGRLWLQYLEMVAILRRSIKAERTGNFELHLQCVKDMLPYFAASGHSNYLKSARLYLQQMLELRVTHPDVFQRFMKGHYSIRRSNRYWVVFRQIS